MASKPAAVLLSRLGETQLWMHALPACLLQHGGAFQLELHQTHLLQ